jgi:cellobiose-specific phosphotransferase system component IIB
MTLKTCSLVLGLVLLAPSGGCSPSLMARKVSSAAVDEGAQELTKQDTQQSLQEAAADPQIQSATRDMTQQIADGVLKALESDQAHQQIGIITRGITQAAVQQMVAALGDDKTREHLAGLTRGITAAAIDQAANSFKSELRPAMRTMLQEDLASGIAGALRSEELQPQLGATAQNVAYNLALGANQGLGKAWVDDSGIARELRFMPGMGRSWLWLGLGALALLTLMFVSVAVMLIARAQRARAEVSRLESATLLLATAMRERQQTEQTDEIVALVQQALEGKAEKTGKHRILSALGMRKHHDDHRQAG